MFQNSLYRSVMPIAMMRLATGVWVLPHLHRLPYYLFSYSSPLIRRDIMNMLGRYLGPVARSAPADAAELIALHGVEWMLPPPS